MDAEQLVAEIARTTGLRITTSDPILAAAVINEILLDKALAKLDRQVKAQADRVTLASTASVEAAKKQADLTVTKAGEWAVAQIKAGAVEAATLVIADIRAETSKVQTASRIAVRAAWATAFCALVVVAGLAGIVLSRLTHG